MDASQKIQELSKKIETAREQVKRLPGIDFTKEEQAAQLKALRKQLVLKEVKIERMDLTFLQLTSNICRS